MGFSRIRIQFQAMPEWDSCLCIFPLLIERCSYTEKSRGIFRINGCSFFKGGQGICPCAGLHIGSAQQYISGTVLRIVLQSLLKELNAALRLMSGKKKFLSFSQLFLGFRRGRLARRNEITGARWRSIGHVFAGIAMQLNACIAPCRETQIDNLNGIFVSGIMDSDREYKDAVQIVDLGFSTRGYASIDRKRTR